MTPEIKRLIEDFGAIDMSVFLEVYVSGRRLRVADWSEGNRMWVLSDDGRDFLAAQDAVQSADTSASEAKPKRERKPKGAATPEPQAGETELDLEEI